MELAKGPLSVVDDIEGADCDRDFCIVNSAGINEEEYQIWKDQYINEQCAEENDKNV